MGSKLGWIMAVIFGGFLVVLIVVVVFFPAATSPTRATTARGMLTLQVPRAPIALVLGTAPDGDGDAGDDYHRALELYETHLPALRNILKHAQGIMAGSYRLGSEELAPLTEIAAAIHQGATKKKMTYYLRIAPKTIEPPYYPVEALEFQDLANVPAVMAGHYAARGKTDYPQSERALFDMLALGYHLMDERARLDLVLMGVGLQKSACDRLTSLYAKWGRPDRAKQVAQYREGLWDVGQVYSELRSVVWQIQKRKGGGWGPHPGDIFNLVANHQDRAVRAEALLGLGMVRHTAGGRGDRRMVRKLMKAKLSSPDAIERAAAQAADAMTMDVLNTLDTQFQKFFDDWHGQRAGPE